MVAGIQGMGMGLIDNLSLAVVSLGASTAAIILAIYLIRKEASPRIGPFWTKDPGPIEAKSPPQAPVYKPVESIGVRLKKRLDEK